MRSFPTGVAVLLLAGALAAQRPAAEAAKDECDQLSAEVKAAVADFQARVKALQATDEYKKAREARDTATLRELTSGVEPVDLKGFTARFQDAAKKYAGTPEEAMFLAWIAQNSPEREAVHAAVETLVASHLDSADFEAFLERALGLMRHYPPADARAKLQEIAARSKKNLVRARAMFLESMILQRDRAATTDDKARIEVLRADAAKLAEGTQLADEILAPKFEQERLQIGMEAPDIAGEDLDGVPFKLSDYRGKVVVLDFWGDW